MEAKIIVMKCGNSKRISGVRVQKMEDQDWYRTWAFKMDESSMKFEKYGSSVIQGSLHAVSGFPGCPYCGSYSFFVCGACDKITCWNGKDMNPVCSWCEKRLTLTVDDSIRVDTSSF